MKPFHDILNNEQTRIAQFKIIWQGSPDIAHSQLKGIKTTKPKRWTKGRNVIRRGFVQTTWGDQVFMLKTVCQFLWNNYSDRTIYIYIYLCSWNPFERHLKPDIHHSIINVVWCLLHEAFCIFVAGSWLFAVLAESL